MLEQCQCVTCSNHEILHKYKMLKFHIPNFINVQFHSIYNHTKKIQWECSWLIYHFKVSMLTHMKFHITLLLKYIQMLRQVK